MPHSPERQSPDRRHEARVMAETFPLFKRWAWSWPVFVALVAILGFKWLTPNARLTVIEEAQAKVPAMVKAAIDSQLLPIRLEVEAQRVRDSVTQLQLQQLARGMTVNTLLQCRQLPPRDAEFLRQLAIACDQTSQRSGIPYRRP